jgi:glycine dehydrogenase subunit 1
MGKSGLTRVAKLSYARAHLLNRKLERANFRNLNSKPFYNEFVVKVPGSAEEIASRLLKEGIMGGVNLGEDNLLICCTEMNSVQDIDDFVSAVASD